jgi:hypothetical protein
MLAALGASLAACRPRQIELPFETIAKSEGFGTGRSPADPNFLVITEPEKVASPGLDMRFPSDLAEQLRAVDYQRTFVVAVFRGTLTGTSPELDVEVLRVVRNGDDVVVQARFGELEPGKLILPGFSSPYQVVAVTKVGEWSGEIRFVFEVDGEEMAERTYFVP